MASRTEAQSLISMLLAVVAMLLGLVGPGPEPPAPDTGIFATPRGRGYWFGRSRSSLTNYHDFGEKYNCFGRN